VEERKGCDFAGMQVVHVITQAPKDFGVLIPTENPNL